MLKRLLSIPAEETTFRRRHFHCRLDSTRGRLERVGQMFLEGYHAALADDGLTALSGRLEAIEPEFRGFGYEGAAMALDLLDQIAPWRGGRVQMFLLGPGQPHIYMVHVGIGWSLARLQLRLERRLDRLEPLLRWLVLDGYGFHEGYFHWERYRGGGPGPRRLSGYGLRAFDQGLGRSLWFLGGADPEWISATIAAFPDARHGDLWSGIGLACAYAGGVDAQTIRFVREVAGSYYAHLVQGAVFAAKARDRAGIPAFQTDLACQSLCNLNARQSAALSDEMLLRAAGGPEPVYETWRHLIRSHFSKAQAREQPIPALVARQC